MKQKTWVHPSDPSMVMYTVTDKQGFFQGYQLEFNGELIYVNGHPDQSFITTTYARAFVDGMSYAKKRES